VVIELGVFGVLGLVEESTFGLLKNIIESFLKVSNVNRSF
jgi:hypothetical protein